MRNAFPKVKWQIGRPSSRSAITGIMLAADGVADLLKAIETADIPGQLQAHLATLAGEGAAHVAPEVVKAELGKMVEKVTDRLKAQLADAKTVQEARKDKIGAFAQEGDYLEMLAKQNQEAEVEDQDDAEDETDDTTEDDKSED